MQQQQPDNLHYALMPVDTQASSPGYTTPNAINGDDVKPDQLELDRLTVVFPQLKNIIVCIVCMPRRLTECQCSLYVLSVARVFGFDKTVLV